MGLGRVGPDGEADGLAQLVLTGPGGPGTCQVALGSVGVPGGQVGGQIAEAGGLGVEDALLELPRGDHALLDHGAPFAQMPAAAAVLRWSRPTSSPRLPT